MTSANLLGIARGAVDAEETRATEYSIRASAGCHPSMPHKRGELTDPLLSVVMPVYTSARRSRRSSRGYSPSRCARVVVVDDGSRDGTPEILRGSGPARLQTRDAAREEARGPRCAAASPKRHGDIVAIRTPFRVLAEEFPSLIEPISGYADVVYGSRFLGTPPRVHVSHYVGNRLLTLITNTSTTRCSSDIETSAR